MELRGTRHGPAFCAPGTFGFFQEGYPFHRHLRRIGLTESGLEFAAKTVTLQPRHGNMELQEDGISPKEILPRCIHINLWNGDVLNAVGLSNPGLQYILATGHWQRLDRPFSISFAMVAELQSSRLKELNGFLDIMQDALPQFISREKLVVQLNFGCPNVCHTQHPITAWEVGEVISRANRLGVALIANFSPVAPRELILAAAQHDGCDGLWLANTIPWGYESIDWRKRYGTKTSPLIKRGFDQPGGYSGRMAIGLSCGTIAWLRHQGIKKPIVGGNGVRHPKDVLPFSKVEANGIAIGCMAITRPFRMRATIALIHRLFPS